MRIRRLLFVLALVAALLVAVPTNPRPAAAAPEDNFSLSKAGPSEALIGEQITYTLRATGTQTSLSAPPVMTATLPGEKAG